MDDGLLEFPCDIPIKVMGRNNAEFRDCAIDIVEQHFADTPMSEQLSRNERFVSLTFTVHANSREAVDLLYRALTGEEQIIMVL